MTKPEQYAADVLVGKIVVCKLIRQAIERHVRDLKDGHKRGLRFDAAEGLRWVKFAETCIYHSKGEWGGRPLVLEPWQAWQFYVFFGWKRTDGTRRFRSWYDEVARKNGKTMKAAIVGLGGMTIDGEPGAEVFAVATKRDQARLVFDDAVAMVRASQPLRDRIQIYKHSLVIEANRCKFEPLSADAKTMDGLNPHNCIVDEVHAHKTREVVDVLKSGLGARRQPITHYITTAGYDRHSVCYELRDYSEKVLARSLVGDVMEGDDGHFATIYTLDDGDDWQDEKTWIKANPNLGVSVKLDFLREECARVKQLPAAQQEFRRKHCNQWTESNETWIDADLWKQNASPFELDDMQGERVFIGLDLATRTDLAAAAYLFPVEDGYKLATRFWVPAENVARRQHKDGVSYQAWIDAGYIETTPGDAIDYAYIRHRIMQDANRFDIIEVASDPWNALETLTRLAEEGVKVTEVRQGFGSLTGPTKELEVLLLRKQLRHDDNPVMNWMVSNVVLEKDAAGNVKPSKAKSTQKIDGVAATVTALAAALKSEGGASVYDTRGPLVLDF